MGVTPPEGSGSGSAMRKTGCRNRGVLEKIVRRCPQHPGGEMTVAWTWGEVTAGAILDLDLHASLMG